jgi:hypothetical protein
MTILHECVHAYRDALGSTFHTRTGRVSTRAVSEEAAALLAGALFYIEDVGPLTVSGSRTPSWALSGVYAQAYSLAAIMRGLTDRFKWCRVSIKHGDHSHGHPKIHQTDDCRSV